MLVFSTELCDLYSSLHLSPFLRFNSPSSPPPCMSTRIQCVRGGGGYGFLSLRQVNICRKVPLQVNFFRWWHFALVSNIINSSMNCTIWTVEWITVKKYTPFTQSDSLVSMSKLNASCLTERRKTKRGKRQGFSCDEIGFIKETSTCAIFKIYLKNWCIWWEFWGATGEIACLQRQYCSCNIRFQNWIHSKRINIAVVLVIRITSWWRNPAEFFWRGRGFA